MLALAVLLAPAVALAYIERMYSFQEVLDESTHVVVGRIEFVDPVKRTAVVVIDRALKGEIEFPRIQMNLGTAAADHNAYVVERLKAGAPVIGFYKRDGAAIASEWHGGGTWFQLFAADDPANRAGIWWRISHVEIRLNRTYSGNTPGLVKLAEDVLTGRALPPAPNPNLPPVDPGRPGGKRLTVTPNGKGSGGFHRQMSFPRTAAGPVGGVAWTDINTDERIDIFLCRPGAAALLVNGGDAFEDRSAQVAVLGRTVTASWADYDGDGHPDLLAGGGRLYTNFGGSLRDDSALVSMPADAAPGSSAWIDSNGDGLPDILTAAGPHGFRLLRNTGKGPKWFVDASDTSGLGAKGLAPATVGHGIACFDYDGDGYTDFLLAEGHGILAHNERGKGFRRVTDSGIEFPESADASAPCGAAAADYDNDGDPDLLVFAGGKVRLYRNNNDGTFTDVTAASGDLGGTADSPSAAAWGDANGDGLPDLVVCYPAASIRLFVGNGKGKFTDITDAVGLKGPQGRGVWAASLADADGDGDLDLAMNAEDRVTVATNEMSRPMDRLPLLVDMSVRKGLVGAVVRAYDEKDRLLGMQALDGADGCGGQVCPIAHFSLPLGRCTISVCLSDGRVARKTVEVRPDAVKVVFDDGEFK